jgi:hypothetical protein
MMYQCMFFFFFFLGKKNKNEIINYISSRFKKAIKQVCYQKINIMTSLSFSAEEREKSDFCYIWILPIFVWRLAFNRYTNFIINLNSIHA